MFVEIKDLEVGDEILIPCQVNFKRLKVERKPAKNEVGYFKRVKCAIRNESVNFPERKWAQYNAKDENYNDSIYMDLTGRSIWLIKKAI